jgi:glutaredoxin
MIFALSFLAISQLKADVGDHQSRQIQKHKIYLFTQTYCPSCLHMKKYFKENNINFVELDIETNPQAKSAFDRIKGRGTPMMVINKKIAYGFNLPFIEENIY